MKPGDTVEVEIEGIGVLRSHIVTWQALLMEGLLVFFGKICYNESFVNGVGHMLRRIPLGEMNNLRDLGGYPPGTAASPFGNASCGGQPRRALPAGP